jgi:hypothetical protein
VTTSRAARILEAGITAFAFTTGALLVFGYSRGGSLLPFITVGRRVVRDVTLPVAVEAGVGLIVHFGQCLALGALVVFLTTGPHRIYRIRAALLTVVLWHLAAMVSWFTAIRADAALNLSAVVRGGLAVILIVALVVGSRGRTVDASAPARPSDD